MENKRELNSFKELMNHHWESITELQKKAQELQTSKLGEDKYEEHRSKNEIELDTVRRIIEHHEVHFAMVENYVDKYSPLAV